MSIAAALADCEGCGPDPAAPPGWLPAAIALTGLVVFVGLLLVATFLSRRDRTVPGAFVPMGAVALGLGASLGPLIVTVRATDLVDLVGLTPILIFVGLACFPRLFGIAGWFTIGATLPVVGWWGFFIVQDLGDPLVSYTDELLRWFAVPAWVLAVGIVLVGIGDRTGLTPRRTPAHEPDPNRGIAIATAYLAARRVGPLDLPNVVSLGLGYIIGLGLSTVLVVLGVAPLLATAIGIVVVVLVATEGFYHVEPRRLSAAMSAHNYLGSWEMARFRREVGGRVPSSIPATAEWLRRHPETDANRWYVAEALIVTGRIDEAETCIERLPTATDEDRFFRRALRVLADQVAGQPADVDGLETAVEEVGADGSDERRRAISSAAIARARQRLIDGRDDWTEPLLAAQPRIGPSALGVFRRDTWWPRCRILLLVNLPLVLLAAVGAAR